MKKLSLSKFTLKDDFTVWQFNVYKPHTYFVNRICSGIIIVPLYKWFRKKGF